MKSSVRNPKVIKSERKIVKPVHTAIRKVRIPHHKELDIDLKSQVVGSEDCVPACVQMVLRHYGVEVDLDKIKQAKVPGTAATWDPDGACLLQRFGVQAAIVMNNPRLFPPDEAIKLKTPLDQFHHVLVKLTEKNFESTRCLLEFLYRGGNLRLEIPSLSHIKQSIIAGHPVIATMYAKALGTKEGGYHAVIVAGYRGDDLLLVNPLPGSKGKDWFPARQVLYGVHIRNDETVGGLLILPQGLIAPAAPADQKGKS